MPIKITCGGCQSKFSVDGSAAGRKAKCPKCQTVIKIPAASLPPEIDLTNLSTLAALEKSAVVALPTRDVPRQGATANFSYSPAAGTPGDLTVRTEHGCGATVLAVFVLLAFTSTASRVIGTGDGVLNRVCRVAIAMLGAMAIPLTIVGILGARTRVRIRPNSTGGSDCLIQRQFAFVTYSATPVALLPSDRLIKTRRRNSEADIDRRYLAIAAIGLLLGGCPGIVFFFVWYHERKSASDKGTLKLELHARHLSQPFVLYDKFVAFSDYHGTASREPKVIQRFEDYFRIAARIPTETVRLS